MRDSAGPRSLEKEAIALPKKPRMKSNAAKHMTAPPGVGRPPNSAAWQVEDRILAAATGLFLERGFDGTSLEEVALAARAGKASVYNRFPSKDFLFVAVVSRSIERTLKFEPVVPESASREECLTSALTELLGRMLTQEVVSVMRLVIAEMPRFPDLAKVREELASRLARGLLALVLDADPTEVGGEADLLMSIVVLPLQFRALMGADMVGLRAEIPERVAAGVQLFLSADAGKRLGFGLRKLGPKTE